MINIPKTKDKKNTKIIKCRFFQVQPMGCHGVATGYSWGGPPQGSASCGLLMENNRTESGPCRHLGAKGFLAGPGGAQCSQRWYIVKVKP